MMVDRDAPTQCGICEPPKPMPHWDALKKHVIRVHLGIHPRIPLRTTLLGTDMVKVTRRDAEGKPYTSTERCDPRFTAIEEEDDG